MSIPRNLIIVFLCFSFFFCSCGKKPIKTEKVTGIITLDGQPLAEATICFNPQHPEGYIGYATTNPEGRYVLQTALGSGGSGTVQGDYIVTVKKSKGIGKPDSDAYRIESLLPDIYNDQQKSPFKVTVKKGTNEFNFELLSKP
jgi:hypothetical protein